MKAKIYHVRKDKQTGYKFMGTVECGNSDWADALEYAFLRTQNIRGSWSRSEYVACGTLPDNQYPEYHLISSGLVELNPDYHPAVTPRAPEEIDGIEHGHRSSMVGDRFIFNGDAYEVASFGFKQIEWSEQDCKARSERFNEIDFDQLISKEAFVNA